jgi:hypothetical protein
LRGGVAYGHSPPKAAQRVLAAGWASWSGSPRTNCLVGLSGSWLEMKTATRRNGWLSMTRLGFEPKTYGLTCCAGSHRSLRLQSGLYHLPRGEPHVKSLRIPQLPDSFTRFLQPTAFPADCPILQIVTLARTAGSQGVPAYGAVLPPASRPGHSYSFEVRCSTD